MSKNKKKQTPADSIPFLYVYQNGIIEIEEGVFSKSYRIPDMNFNVSGANKQQDTAVQYRDMIVSFGLDADVEITMYNKTVNLEKFRRDNFIQDLGDGRDEYRHEYNKMLEDKIVGSNHNFETERILTVSIKADDIKNATDKFKQIDSNVKSSMQLITKETVNPMSIDERLDMLAVIYNGTETFSSLSTKRMVDGHESAAFSLESCIRQGISPKDVIAPPVMEFERNSTRMGDQYTASFAPVSYPTWLKGDTLTSFSDIACNVLVSVHFRQMDQGKAIRMLKDKRLTIDARIADMQKKASNEGIVTMNVSPELQRASEETVGLMDEMTRSDTKMYVADFVITLIADSEKQLKECTDQMQLIATRTFLDKFRPLSLMQEQAFNTSLPLGTVQIKKDRLITSDNIACLIPFNMLELSQKNGLYYGQNAITNSLIFCDRGQMANPNSCILGMPGTGKSFAAKREMVSVVLNTNDEIYILDPEREYAPLANALGGSIIKFANGTKNFINPFDINLKNAEDGADPVKVKSDFIVTICQIMIGGKYGLSPIEEALIDRCAMNIYDQHVKYLRASGKTSDPATAPTLLDFYNELLAQPSVEAQNIALALERYVKGGLDIFSHHTTMEIDNRFTVYDIKDIGSGLTELGLQICLDNIWNKMIENKEQGKRTWLYIDEFYKLMKRKSSASYISEIWKRARKWDGRPCAITQNVEDMLNSEEARTVINNCSFVMMLGQSPMNKQQLSKIFNISEDEQKWISSTHPGSGLIHLTENDNNIPFVDNFPQNTKLYKIMSTKPEERL